MCMFNQPKMTPPALPKEPAQMKQPDGGAVRSSTSRRVTDQMRAGASTILTRGSGAMATASTDKKTLLGQ